ncbi:hypothetical protein B0O99DRAFT_336726 [Bisporella sp. PMI_857]|nr:hypothetical protein B0O99DRAFT_336726 [Bisporella sp. PMI_857]
MDVSDLAFRRDKFDGWALSSHSWPWELDERDNLTVILSTTPDTASNTPASTNSLSLARRCSFTASQVEALRSYTPDDRKPRFSGKLHNPQLELNNLRKIGDTELAGFRDERKHCSAGIVTGECQAIAHGCINPDNLKKVGSTSSVALSMTSFTSTHTPSTSSVNSRKFQLGDEEDNSCDEAKCCRYSKRQKSKRAGFGEPVREFACPYRKHDPRKYEIQKWRNCAVAHWSSVSRVKEHLYRSHMVINCTRCGTTFKTHEDLDSHMTNATPCLLAVTEVPEGITPHILRALKSRKKAYPNQPEEERWKEVYKILFPYEDVPSPCKFQIQPFVSFSPTKISKDNIDFEPVVEETVRTLDLDDFEEYSRREMPKILKPLLETNFSFGLPGSDKWRNELVSAVEHCQSKIISNYRLQSDTRQYFIASTTESTPDETPEGRPKTAHLEHVHRGELHIWRSEENHWRESEDSFDFEGLLPFEHDLQPL